MNPEGARAGNKLGFSFFPVAFTNPREACAFPSGEHEFPWQNRDFTEKGPKKERNRTRPGRQNGSVLT